MSRKLGILSIILIVGVAIAAIFPYVSMNPDVLRGKLHEIYGVFST
ncbi:hypothetical protein [Paenibacillus roseipurpureus]|uniref:Uncharacterized protein n=1 Tax=Paenibacillus roseopurpureus TaxID=2918901 RepID=A0AA96LNU8_9BACL|nr:hypothetical protein [Paenibacillus sp. MBLB1832]WNR45452.1 hypothetical protein MJB10_04775 [Paenibacillus sp. MBLB1832]